MGHPSTGTNAVWRRAAALWIFDSIKWILLFGLVLPGLLSAFQPFPAYPVYYGSQLLLGPVALTAVVLAATIVACTVISRAQALSRTAALLACFGFIVGPLVLGLLIPREVIVQFAIYTIAVCSLVPIGIIGLFWILFRGTHNLSHGGMTAFIRGRPKTALSYFALAASKGPADREQALAFAVILSAKGHPHKAALVCGLLIQNEPTNVLFWRAKASFEWLAGDFEASYQASQAAIALDPQNAALYFERAVRKARHQQTRLAAVEDLQRALQLNPNHQEYQQILAILLELPAEAPLPATLPGEDRLFSSVAPPPQL